MTQQDFSPAKVFANLANDQVFIENYLEWHDSTGRRIMELKLDMARLALMVVEKQRYILWDHGDLSSDAWTQGALVEFGINPSHYAKVKERVEGADTEAANKKLRKET